MIRLHGFAGVAALNVLIPSSCSKREPAAPSASDSPRATVVMRDGTKVAASVKAGSTTGITLAGDDQITRTIPMDRVRSVEYGALEAAVTRKPAPRETAARTRPSESAPATRDRAIVGPVGPAIGLTLARTSIQS